MTVAAPIGAGAAVGVGELFGVAWPPPSGPVFWVSVCLVLAGLLGEVCFRFLRLPRLVGYVATGFVAGGFGVGVVEGGLPEAAQTVLELALALLLFEAGSRISLRWLRSNPWLLVYCLAEALLTFVVVVSVLEWFDVPRQSAVPLAAIAMATSPAVLMRVASEFRTAGQVTERMMVMSGINTCLAVLVSRFVSGWLLHESGGDLTGAILLPIYQLAGSTLIAGLIAGSVILLSRHFDLRSDYAAILLIGILLLGLSLSTILRQSALLVPLLAGMMLKNFSERPGAWPRQFGTAGGLLILMLFVTTGAAWSPQVVAVGGMMAALLVLGRLLAKMVMAVALSRPSGISLRQGVALGLTGIPMSAPALAMFGDLHTVTPYYAAELAPILFSSVLAVELLGPVVVRLALRWAGEEQGA